MISIRKLKSSLILSQTILAAALNRNESRGAHFKPEFPERDDVNWLKTTLANYDTRTGEVNLHYQSVDLSLMSPADEAAKERRW